LGKTATRRGEREPCWQRLIRDQPRSGSSSNAFCRSHGVWEPSFSALPDHLTELLLCTWFQAHPRAARKRAESLELGLWLRDNGADSVGAYRLCRP
jgi:hypothetical protein